ncbi:MAG: hypothetical protein HZB66_00210 [Candidatus Aenigmarchaeota archaeon]|nr:hypothetical protein [Candidatus Aenigmarchaeota archaeon]
MKGYIYTLEVLIAASLIFVTLALIYKTPPIKPEMQLSTMEKTGSNALDYFYEKGDMRIWAYYNNESIFESELRNVIPRSVDFEISLSRECDSKNVPENRTVIVVTRYISGLNDKLDIKKVCLYMWEGY